MKHSKHTPGPWTIETYHNAFFRIVRDRDSAELPSECGPANAALIAAAPELLEALERIFRHYCANDDLLMNNAIRESQAILTKARGES